MTQSRIIMFRHHAQLSPVESSKIEAWRTLQQFPDRTVKPTLLWLPLCDV